MISRDTQSSASSMGEPGLRRFLFCVDRITLQPLEAAPIEKLSTRLRIFPPCDLWRAIPIPFSNQCPIIVLICGCAVHACLVSACAFCAMSSKEVPTSCLTRVYASAGLSEYLSPAALPEKGFFEAPNAVVVQKGDTELLPIKFDIQFVTDIQTLIEVIKCGALLSIEVFHSTARAGEHIVGRAHVPLQPLLSETWVQGKAPVWANMYDGTQPSTLELCPEI